MKESFVTKRTDPHPLPHSPEKPRNNHGIFGRLLIVLQFDYDSLNFVIVLKVFIVINEIFWFSKIPLGIILLLRSQNFWKVNISYPLIRTRLCAYQGAWNVSFSENFANVINEWSLGILSILLILLSFSNYHSFNYYYFNNITVFSLTSARPQISAVL